MKEIWKPIEGYEGYYEVSNLGNVRSLKRDGYKNGNLNLGHVKAGYCIVVLFKDGKGKTCSVHRLVAKAFLPNPQNKPLVNHIDSNRANNNVNNLEWVTWSENACHAFRSGSRVVSEKQRNRCREMGKKYGSIYIKAINEKNQRKVAMIKDGKEIKRFDSLKEGAKYVGTDCSSGVWSCCNGKMPTYKGYVWKYID